MSKKRGCGSRQRGAAYLECPLGPGGLPVEHFIVDEPHIIIPEEFGLTPVGVKLVDRGLVTHVMDWVGGEYYPNVADFVEEVKVLGLSRRVSKNLDFSRLGWESKILLVHGRAWDANFAKYPAATLVACPKTYCPCTVCGEVARRHARAEGEPLHVMCAACWWHNLEDVSDPREDGAVTREMPAFSYVGRERPAKMVARYKPAIFMKLPIANIAVIKDPEGGKHVEALEKAAVSALPVILKDE